MMFASSFITIIGFLLTWYIFGPAKTYGVCKLSPQKPANIARIQDYWNQGIHYSSEENWPLATRAFREVLAIDKNYLGANQNLGSAYLARKDYKDAEESFDKELQLIDCLSAVGSNGLPKFGYMMPASSKNAGDDYKQRLDEAQEVTHFDLACLRARESDKWGAAQELNAIKHRSIAKDIFINDPDLKSMRQSPEFKNAVASSPPAR
ncbi:MAG: hypothetical protein M3Y72_06845 [Acidobacteriota bacterium]|nr:hypothetical protein [Acidobacteriota bacterium]